jgi:hypothetical protein
MAATCLLHPKAKPTSKHWHAYDVTLGGEMVVTDSRDPEFDAARALLARGIVGVAVFVDANTGKARIRINIEKAAKTRTYEDCRGIGFERWKAFEPLAVRAHSREAGFRAREAAE